MYSAEVSVGLDQFAHDIDYGKVALIVRLQGNSTDPSEHHCAGLLPELSSRKHVYDNGAVPLFNKTSGNTMAWHWKVCLAVPQVNTISGAFRGTIPGLRRRDC